ncbi:hypothetical protein GCM10010216_60790 [Streptomyces flaveolus]|nr:hypothetical protein GCM10010216_60790 [Streptomyces flaveolus]
MSHSGMTEPTTAPVPRTGGCQCGEISYAVTGAPDDPRLCSCPAGHSFRESAVPWMTVTLAPDPLHQ